MPRKGRCQAALKQERELKFALETARQQSPGEMSWGDPTRFQKLMRVDWGFKKTPTMPCWSRVTEGDAG